MDPGYYRTRNGVTIAMGSINHAALIMIMIIVGLCAPPSGGQQESIPVDEMPNSPPPPSSGTDDQHHHLPSWMVGVIITLLLVVFVGGGYISCICKRRWRRQRATEQYTSSISIQEIEEIDDSRRIAAPQQQALPA